MNRNALWMVLSLSLPFAVSTGLASTALADTPPAAVAEARAEVPPSVIEGKFQRYLVSPRGQITGILLDGGMVVGLPPAAQRPGAPELTAGDTLRIEGRVLKTPTGALVTRALVQRERTVIADARSFAGHPHAKGEHKKGEHKKGEHKKGELAPIAASGKIVAIVSTPKGKIAGLLLDDGTTARAAGQVEPASLPVKLGDLVTLTGKGGTYAKGKGMLMEEIKLPSGEVKKVEASRHHRRHHGTLS